MRIKLITAIVLGLFMVFSATAQYSVTQSTASATLFPPSATNSLDGQRNIIKLNIAAIALNNYSLQYERAITPKVSAAIGVSHRPKGSLPMLNSFESLIDDAYTFQQLQDITVSNTAFTPEVRFYLGKHGAPRGFYIAPYARFSTYQLELGNFEYTVEYQGDAGLYEETKHIDLDGNFRSTTGGILFGAQWRLTKLLYLDWWMLGAAYGGSRGKLTAVSPLTAEEQYGLREALQDLDIPLVDNEVTVDENGARMDLKGPWTGLRMGITLGVRF